jgi:hypothetical protein
MTHQNCGYRGHCCQEGKVQFISRYRMTNDYCVGGKRVYVSDEGKVGNATLDDMKAIYEFERARYFEYLAWRETCNLPGSQVLPFDAGIRLAVERAGLWVDDEQLSAVKAHDWRASILCNCGIAGLVECELHGPRE